MQSDSELSEYEYIDVSALSESDDSERKAPSPVSAGPGPIKMERKPETIDDFIRNFLSRNNMARTLELFQKEWYFSQDSHGTVEHAPLQDESSLRDVYAQNKALEKRITAMTKEMDRLKKDVREAARTYTALDRDKDAYSSNRSAVDQENRKLTSDMKKLETHLARYEPAVKEMKKRYVTAMKEKSVTKLERDRIVDKLKAFSETKAATPQPRTLAGTTRERTTLRARPSKGLTLTLAGDEEDLLLQLWDEAKEKDRVAVEGFRCVRTIQAHEGGVNGLFPICNNGHDVLVLTAGNDGTWKMFDGNPGGSDDPLVVGHGHTDWLSSVSMSFDNAQGTVVTTGGGDNRVMAWSVGAGGCTGQVLATEEAPVWASAFHHSGDYFLTAGMKTVRLWDVEGKNYAFHGHTDAVNSVRFRPLSNLFCTASADNSVSIWDPRVDANCVQTMMHSAAVNDAVFSPDGERLFSCDAAGFVAVHDIRATKTPLDTIPPVAYPTSQAGHSVNSIDTDPTGKSVICGSNANEIRILNLEGEQTSISTLDGSPHVDMVNAVRTFSDGRRTIVYTASSDGTVKVWSA
ncbi:WD domain G-beta repeat [Carpediemonas membranifera]|uniref:WD domain G-beta repeat n=1 Tax=Carpediemonas membranifera TaxID=201153 RepID=A0A8J6AWP5_9EUKA|nr:WD domain G-beta repeat [Carpediemonas membranifera]|eukprot:KAG9390198.1 WD domain G-beta repeat [Carpediemonas membranifera]